MDKQRRAFITNSILLSASLILPATLRADSNRRRGYKIAVIDLMILKRQKLSAFDLAKEIGADGLEVDMGGLGDRPTFDSKLSSFDQRKLFLDKSKQTGVEIC